MIPVLEARPTKVPIEYIHKHSKKITTAIQCKELGEIEFAESRLYRMRHVEPEENLPVFPSLPAVSLPTYKSGYCKIKHLHLLFTTRIPLSRSCHCEDGRRCELSNITNVAGVRGNDPCIFQLL